MKKSKLFLLLWILLTTLGCKTIEYVDVPVNVYVEVDPEWEEPPVRAILGPKDEDMPMSTHLMNRIVYYSELVELWESWGIQAYESIDHPLPESLELVKTKPEEQ